jgi:hypothetical protein
MTKAKFAALMLVRRALGDVGAVVSLNREDFLELAGDSLRGPELHTARESGLFTLLSCNGRTFVRDSRKEGTPIV